MGSKIEKINAACELHGAYEVRKAAIRQMNDDLPGLESVGIADCLSEFDVFTISDFAFSKMTNDEKNDEFLSEQGLLK